MGNLRRLLLLSLAGTALTAAIVVPLFLYLTVGSSDGPDGPVEAKSQVSQEPEDLAGYCSSLTAGNNPYVGNGQRAKLLQLLENPSFQAHSQFVSVRILLARDHLRFGETNEAVRLLGEALQAEDRDDPRGRHRAELLEALAVAEG